MLFIDRLRLLQTLHHPISIPLPIVVRKSLFKLYRIKFIKLNTILKLTKKKIRNNFYYYLIY
jgi:hypothetical protein